jgi:hypothetical protein
MAITFDDVILQKVPKEYNTAAIEVDTTKNVDETFEWSKYFDWNVGGTTVSVEKAIVIPVKLTDGNGNVTEDYIVVGYLGAGGS